MNKTNYLKIQNGHPYGSEDGKTWHPLQYAQQPAQGDLPSMRECIEYWKQIIQQRNESTIELFIAFCQSTTPPAQGEGDYWKMPEVVALRKETGLALKRCKIAVDKFPNDIESQKAYLKTTAVLSTTPPAAGGEIVDLPRPIGDFILAQKDIKPTMGANGAYYHYADVCTILNRLTKNEPLAAAGGEREKGCSCNPDIIGSYNSCPIHGI